MKQAKQLPPRSKVKTSDTWDLASLFPNDDAWEEAFAHWEKQVDGYARFRGTLRDGPEALAKCLKFDTDFDRHVVFVAALLVEAMIVGYLVQRLRTLSGYLGGGKL